MFEQLETLFAGKAALAAVPLRSEEEALLRRVLPPGSVVERHVRGRVRGAGWGLWAITCEKVVFVDLKGRKPPRLHPHAAVARIEAITGKWGATLIVEAGGTREAVFAADAALGDAFFAALAAYCPAVPAPEKLVAPAPPQAPPAPARAASLDSTRTASPVASSVPPGATQAVDGLRIVAALGEAAALREKGLLTDTEFAAIKRRLLAE